MVPKVLSAFQFLVIPLLLNYHLTRPSTDGDTISILGNIPTEFWKFFIVKATPLFTLLEGFASLLVVQAIGQTTK